MSTVLSLASSNAATFSDSTTGDLCMTSASGANILVGQAGAASAVRIGATGVTFGANVGVGTASPTHALDVAGDVNVTGAFKVNGASLSTTLSPTYAGALSYDGSTLSLTGNLSVTGTVGAGAISLVGGGGAASGASTNATFSNLAVTGTLSTSNQLRDGVVVLYNPAGSSAPVSNGNYYGFGAASNALKYSVDASGSHAFYSSSNRIMALSTNSCVVSGTSNPHVYLSNNVLGSGGVALITRSGDYAGDSAVNDLVIRNDNAANGVRILAGGGNTMLTVTSNAVTIAGALTCSGDITAFSDASLKTDLVRITGAMDKVDRLTGYTYRRIDVDDDGARRSTGLLAQDVARVLPEAVRSNARDGFPEALLSVSYGSMMGLVVEAMKDLRAEVTDLREEVRRLNATRM